MLRYLCSSFGGILGNKAEPLPTSLALKWPVCGLCRYFTHPHIWSEHMVGLMIWKYLGIEAIIGEDVSLRVVTLVRL